MRRLPAITVVALALACVYCFMLCANAPAAGSESPGGYSSALPAGGIKIELDSPVVGEGASVNGSISTPLAGEDVRLLWIDPFSGVWYSDRFRTTGGEPVRFSFQALGAGFPVRLIDAVSQTAKGSAVVTAMPKADTAWNGFLVAADKPPQASPDASFACRDLGCTAAFASGYSECLAAASCGLRPLARGLVSAGTLSLPVNVFARALAEYEKSGAAAALARVPSLADTREIARLASEAESQVSFVRRLAPMCFVVADTPSTTKGNVPLDFSFAPEDIQAFRAFVESRLASEESIARHWTRAALAAHSGAIPPETARQTKARVLGEKDVLVDVAPWALHREYMDKTLADVVRSLSRRAADAARRPDAEDFNWNLITPVVGVTGMTAPSAYGGFDWSELASSANVFFFTQETPQWALGLARDLCPDGRVIACVDADSPASPAAAWHAAALGAGGVVVSNYGSLLAGVSSAGAGTSPAAARANDSSNALPAVLAEVTSGLADIMIASRKTSPVAIAYSPAAVRAGWMVDYIAAEGFSPAPPDAGTEALAAWSKILADLGVGFTWIQFDAITSGQILTARPQALILPETWCIDAQSAQALTAYVNAGGTLIADNATGLLDGEYAAYEKPPLDMLFGIARRPLTGAMLPAVAPGATRPAASFVADVSVSPSRSASATRTPGGATAVLRLSGRGGTVYLNMFVEAYLKGDASAKAAVRAAVEQALGAALVSPLATVYQDKKPVPFQVSALDYGNTRICFLEPLQGARISGKVDVQFPLAGCFYNLRPTSAGGEYLGNNAYFTLDVPASGPIVLARSEFPLTGLGLELEFSQGAVLITARVQADRAVGDRLLRLELYDPSGRRMSPFDRTVVAPSGAFIGSIDLPDNVPTGTWRLLARDLETGMASWSDVSIQ